MHTIHCTMANSRVMIRSPVLQNLIDMSTAFYLQAAYLKQKNNFTFNYLYSSLPDQKLLTEGKKRHFQNGPANIH